MNETAKNKDEFVWDDNLVMEFALQTKVNGTKDCVCSQIEHFKASKQRKPLFTTEDGKQIFEMQEYFDVCLVDYSISKCMMKHRDPIEKDKFLPFSTEAAAREYVMLNKPIYSLNDIGDAWEKLCHEAFTYDQLITELEKLKQ